MVCTCQLCNTLVLMCSLVVSLVDGYNLPMRIDNNKGCHIADCPVDLGPNCALITFFRRVCLLMVSLY